VAVCTSSRGGAPAADLAIAADLKRSPDLMPPDFGDCGCGLLPLETHRAPFWIADVATGDFDGDGHADFVIANGGVQTAARRELQLFRGRGDGSFAEPTRAALEGTPYQVAAADFDRDGRADLAIVTLDPRVSEHGLALIVRRGSGLGVAEYRDLLLKRRK
jgi:hypothetical protein